MSFEKFEPFKHARLGASAINELNRGLNHLISTQLWAKVLFSLLLGIVFGLLLGPGANILPPHLSELIVHFLALPGQLFLSLIQFVIIPLVFASVVLGIVSSDSVTQLKSLGVRMGGYYIFTTLIAVAIGFSVAFLIKPGRYIDPEVLKLTDDTGIPHVAGSGLKWTSFNDFISGLIPSNPFGAFVSGEMLQIVLLAVFLGIALMSLKDTEARPVLDLLNAFQKISMTVIHWAMSIAPIAVFALTARLLAQLGVNALLGVGAYVGTVILGLALVQMFYLILIKVFTKKSPLEFLKNIRDVQLLAFSTSSSASVMPLTIETAQNKLGVRSSISQFVIPLGSTVNMDGTAMYQGVATLFLAQVFGVELGFGELALVVATATLSSIGAPGAPGVGMAILSVILANVGIPPSGIVILLGVDRLLDMCRTVINITGDLTASLIMEAFADRERIIFKRFQRNPIDRVKD